MKKTFTLTHENKESILEEVTKILQDADVERATYDQEFTEKRDKVLETGEGKLPGYNPPPAPEITFSMDLLCEAPGCGIKVGTLEHKHTKGIDEALAVLDLHSSRCDAHSRE